MFFGMKYWFIILITTLFVSCSNLNTSNAVELSKIEVIDRVIFYEGQKYNGVVYHVFEDPNRKLFNVDSPIKIKGVPIEISKYIDYAFTVVDGKINGSAIGTLHFNSMVNFQDFMLSDEKEIYKAALGLYFYTNIVSSSNIYGETFEDDIKVFNSRGVLLYSLDNDAFIEYCRMGPDDVIVKNSGKNINFLNGKISNWDDDVWSSSYSKGKNENGEWEVWVIKMNRLTGERIDEVGGLELLPKARPLMSLGDFYNNLALKKITVVY